ncbi:MAG TPA: hypothetical protein DD414_12600, partial [Lachnospiraceae bacterium]|nr:hypothetical protein [Lachnospiraceae bacterium]
DVTDRVTKQERKKADSELKKNRIGIIGNMIKLHATKEQIISYGFTEDEYQAAKGSMDANSIL